MSQKPAFFPKQSSQLERPALPSSPLATSAACMGLWRTPKRFTGRGEIALAFLSPQTSRLLGGFMLPYKTGWQGFYSSLEVQILSVGYSKCGVAWIEWMAFLFWFNGRRVTDFCPSGCQRGLCGPHLLHGYLITHSWTYAAWGLKKWRTLIFLTVGREQLNSNWFWGELTWRDRSHLRLHWMFKIPLHT